MAGTPSTTVDYRVRWKPGGVVPGMHRGTQAGIGHELRASVPFHAHPDPRRLDLRSSLRDPYQRLWVHDCQQSVALKLYVLADVSASMTYQGRQDKFAQLQTLVATLAHSAWRSGDRFGMLAADEQLREELSLPARLNRSAGEWLQQRLRRFQPQGCGAQGLLQAAARLPGRRALVFLISDFHWPQALLPQLLQALAAHDVVPLVLWDTLETPPMRRHGLARLRDPETGAQRSYWLRPALQPLFEQAYAQRRQQLQAQFQRAGRRALFIDGPFTPQLLNAYFREAL